MQQQKNKDLQERFKSFDNKLLIWQICTVIFCGILVIYLFLIQVIDVRDYRAKGKKQRSASNYIMRGDIVDRNGIKLASDKITYDAWAFPKEYADAKLTAHTLAVKLSPVLNLPVKSLERTLSQNLPLISLKKAIDRETAERIQNLDLGYAISLDKDTKRVYPQGSLAAHILGYYNTNADIPTGVEKTAQKKLEDFGEKVDFEKTPQGDLIYSLTTNPELTTVPLKGKTVKLTIDTAIQHVCEEELFKMVKQKRAARGAVIAMNPRNGEILGYSVYPTYDPNKFNKYSWTVLKNWSLTDVYEPGSTFKILTVTSAMELGKINRNTRVLDTGKIQIDKWSIENYDYRKVPYPGQISLEYLFKHSSNIGAVKVAQLMTYQEFYEMLKKFGLGEKTGIDLPGESNGILKDARKWNKSDQATMGFGYGASVTAIQMISAISALANDGVRVTPHIIKYEDEEELAKHVKYTRVIREETAKEITKILSNIKSQVDIDSYKIAVKTGTSRKTKEGEKGYTSKVYTSIVGYLPASDPQLIIYVVVDSAAGEAWGSTVAAPIFKEVAIQCARILNLTPDKKSSKKKKIS